SASGIFGIDPNLACVSRAQRSMERSGMNRIRDTRTPRQRGVNRARAGESRIRASSKFSALWQICHDKNRARIYKERTRVAVASMKRILLACVMVGTSGASFAAELATPQLYRPTPVVAQRLYDWTGLYFGVNAGYGWGHADSSVIFTGNLLGGFTTPGGLGPTELTQTALAGTGRLSGALAGGGVGFNFQAGSIVFGGELDGQWSGQRGSFAVNCNTGCTASLSPRIKSLVTARARVGYS